jgi:excreted virulence factor EspC (type VII ESX diderm)
MDDIADRLESAADRLSTMDRSVPSLAVPPGALGADDIGLPGRLGRELHAHWVAVLDARSSEAAQASAHLNGLATELRKTAQDYADTDDSVGRRLKREG